MEQNQTQNLGNKIEEVERITRAAVRLRNGRIVEGKLHTEILDQIHKENSYILYEREEGFITNKGRFVPRREAAEIAFKAGQTPERKNSLSSQDLDLS